MLGHVLHELLVRNALEELAQLYAMEKLTIGSTDTQYDNQPSILNILLMKAAQVKFSADSFQLLTVILRMESGNGDFFDSELCTERNGESFATGGCNIKTK